MLAPNEVRLQGLHRDAERLRSIMQIPRMLPRPELLNRGDLAPYRVVHQYQLRRGLILRLALLLHQQVSRSIRGSSRLGLPPPFGLRAFRRRRFKAYALSRRARRNLRLDQPYELPLVVRHGQSCLQCSIHENRFLVPLLQV